MSQDPKKLPGWLRGKGKKQEEAPPQSEPLTPEPPQQDVPPSSADSSDLPPWLRGEQPPAPATGSTSKLRRLSAQPPPEQQGELPPWLAGMEESKSVKIGGTELSEEYLKSADELPDTLDTEMTYDSWMAQQVESKRVKDIEEEIPSDLIDLIKEDQQTETAPVESGEKKATGQLPDWFLGLEELDTTEAPDWFQADDNAPKAPSDQTPPWINDMVEEEPAEETPPTMDDIGSFFSSIGSVEPAGEEEEEPPDLDWFSAPEEPEQRERLPDTGFFRQLVGKGDPEPPSEVPSQTKALPSIDDTQPKPPPPPPAKSSPAKPQFELPDIDDFEDEPPEHDAAPHVDIPQNELDAFFDNVAADRGIPPASSFDDIEDPDMEWIVPPEPEPEPEPEAELPPEPRSEDSINWLNELQGIVNSATRPLQPPPEEIVPKDIAKAWEAPPVQETSSESDAFAWPETEYVEPEPQETSQESDWFASITPDDDQPSIEDEINETPAPTAPPAGGSLLSGRLRQAQEQKPSQPTPESEDELPPEETLIPEDELQTGWLTDDLLADEQGGEQPSAQPPPADDTDFFSMLEANADANLLDEPPDDSLNNASTLFVPRPSEAQSEAPAEQAISDDMPSDDFFASLNFGDDQQREEQPSAEPKAESQDDQFYSSLFGDEQRSEQPSTEQATSDDMPSDDFFASLNFGDEQAEEQPSAEPDVEPQDDQFYSSLFGDEQDNQQPAASDEGTFASWSDEQPIASESDAEPQDDQFYSSLFGDEQGSERQSAEQASSDDMPSDDFFASLNFEDERAEEQPPAAQSFDGEMPQTGDLFGSPSFADDQADSQVESSASDDLFSSLNTEDVDEQPPAASEEGVFAQWSDQPIVESDEIPAEDDFFAALDMNDALEEEPVSEHDDAPDDFFTSLGLADQADASPTEPVRDNHLIWNVPSEEEAQSEPEADAPAADPYREWDAPQREMPPEEDFFAALGMIGDAQPTDAQPANQDTSEAPPEEDFFKSLGMLNDEAADSSTRSSGSASTTPAFGDVDSYLASLQMAQSEMTPTTDDTYERGINVDIDALFSEPVLPEQTEKSKPDDMLPAVNADWLAQLEASVGEVSASAIVRQKEDKPVEELSDRLKKLRARAEQIPDEASTPAAESNALTNILPGVPSALAAAPVSGTESTLLQNVVLTADQQNKVNLLRALVPLDERVGTNKLSAIEATYDSPFMPGLEDTEQTVVQPAKEKAAPKGRARKRQRQRIVLRPDRFLIAVILALAVILPFLFTGFRVGSLPPSSFAAGSVEQIAFSQLDRVKPGSLVLVGVEYGPTAAAELDGMTEAIIRHILLRASYPVLISGDALGSLRISDLFAPINADTAFLQRIGMTQPLAANHDYYIVRYLPGSVIGLRAFSENTTELLLTDIEGQASNLHVKSLRDFALVTVVTDRAETVRNYAEQIMPLAQSPLVSAVSYSAAPLAEPYARTLGGGLLIGYQDSYTYNVMLGTANTLNMGQRVRIIPTDEPTVAAPLLPAESQDELPAEVSTEAATSEAAGTEQASLGTAMVISKNAVNMRSGPGTSNAVIGIVPSGSQVTVIGYNADRSWVNVSLDSGEEGWISAALLNITPKTALSHLDLYGKQRIDPGQPTSTPRVSREASPATSLTEIAPTANPSPTEGAGLLLAQTTSEAALQTTEAAPLAQATETAIPTVTASASATAQATAFVGAPNITFTLPPHSDGYQNERWYAMNLGIIASAIVIGFGAVFNVVRGLLRRGQRG